MLAVLSAYCTATARPNLFSFTTNPSEESLLVFLIIQNFVYL